MVFRIVLGGLFIYAGLSKVFDPGAFADAIRTYELGLPQWFVSVVAHGLPFVEILLGFYLVVGLFTRASALLTVAIMVVFILALVQGAVRGLEIDCACFGAASSAEPGSLWVDALRDVGLLLMGVQIALAPVSRVSVDALRGRAGGRLSGAPGHAE